MVVVKTEVLQKVRTCTCEDENARFPIPADLIIDQSGAGPGTIDHDSREDPLGRPTGCNRAGRIKEVDRRMLIAADIPKANALDQSLRDLLQIEGSAAPIEDLNSVSSGAHEHDGAARHEDLVLVKTRADKDLIFRARLLQSKTRKGVAVRVSCIDHQSFPAPRIRGNRSVERRGHAI